MKNRILIAMLLLIPGWLLAETELKGSPEELRQFLHPVENTVTLTGTHEETAFSDKAKISLIITTETERLGDSMKANSALRTTISQSLVDAGVEAEEINTSKFSSSPQFGWFGSKPKSFEVVNRMSVGITDEAHLQLLANLTDDNDEVVMAGMEFEHTARDDFQNKVKATALDKALAQKAAIEEQLGVELIPIGLNERMAAPSRTMGANMIEEVVVTAQRADSASRVRQESFAASPPAQTFDEVVYQATLFVTFKVVQK